MDIALRQAIAEAITANPRGAEVIENLELRPDSTGVVTYASSIWVDPTAPGFSGNTTELGDEEMVRAYLTVRLADRGGYPVDPSVLEVERVYKPVGRPTGKGGRIDAIVRRRDKKAGLGPAFLFIECKAPDKFDSDMGMIDGQLFLLSRQEDPRPRYLVYYTVDLKDGALRERMILIDTQAFGTFEEWDAAGQPITDTLPVSYGEAQKRRYANVAQETDSLIPLDTSAGPETLNRLRSEIHDVIWGGGGTNNNEVFVYIAKLILCKIYDEKETPPGRQYEFQRFGDAVNPEAAGSVSNRMNSLYRKAENAYLALPRSSAGPAFDASRISDEKMAYVVGRLESIAVTENTHRGDLMGEFFEQIVSQDFTQTKGQFLTPMKLVHFMLRLLGVVDRAEQIMLKDKDHLGRPRLPYVIDPSCGSGTFVIEYMKLIRERIGTAAVAAGLAKRVKESHETWFGGLTRSAWAREYLFGVENNYDLGLSAKVNMVLHGDGSMNTWIANGLLPFGDYVVSGRNNVLGEVKTAQGHPYPHERNEQFDFVLSNPPFSVKMPEDEKAKVERAFTMKTSSGSESLFIERWYQLLRDGGLFCCVLPEAVLDTSTNSHIRLFILQHFKVRAIVSLPYDAFRPFTSTKTCIVLAEKRDATAVENWAKTWAAKARAETERRRILEAVLSDLGMKDEPIFMAEPSEVGYKRRKSLPDLPRPNFLYPEDASGTMLEASTGGLTTVVEAWESGTDQTSSAEVGFWTTLGAVASRDNFRMDPKYRWLWDKQNGLVLGEADRARPLSETVKIVALGRIPKGDLASERRLVDLEQIESRQAYVRDQVPLVDTIGSDRVALGGCEIAIAKLEPYLAKIVVQPESDWIGSPEWIGFNRRNDFPLTVLAYLLMLPQMCEAYRRLQAGKRHARFDPKEFLQLRIELPEEPLLGALLGQLGDGRARILALRKEEQTVRAQMDAAFSYAAS